VPGPFAWSEHHRLATVGLVVVEETGATFDI
jgi:hypothetical protein